MARGGRRAGAPGRSYNNRTDLNLARAPQQQAATAPLPAPTAGGPAQPAQPTQAAAPAAGPPPPGSLNILRPTERPGEPLTHGLPTGPGGGPEVLQPLFQPDPLAGAAASLNAIPDAHLTPQLAALKASIMASTGNAMNPAASQ